jgi:hypothetical protein
MYPWLVGIDFRGQGQTTIFPFGVTCPGFLLAANVRSGCVDFVVASSLEVVECFCIVVEVGYAGSSGRIRTCVLLASCGCDGVLNMLVSSPKVINPRMTRSVGVCATRGMLEWFYEESIQVEKRK